MATRNGIEDMCISECPEQQLCATLSKISQEDSIGSAAMHSRYLLVEVPLPWEYKVVDSRHFPAGLVGVLDQAKEQGEIFRFLSFESDDHLAPQGYRRVLYYQRPSASFAKFVKKEYLVPETELNALAMTILQQPEYLERFAAYALDSTDVRDLFVCTHGSHDVCCGKFGYPIYRRLVEDYAEKSAGKLRVWRASHFGGHRYAPTIADLPEGRYWAQVEVNDLDTLVLRNGAFAEISRKYRGWGGVGKYEQMLEREIFIREGWDWIDYNKTGAVIKEEEGAVQVRIEYFSNDGAVSGVYEGTVVECDSVNVGGCGYEVKPVQQYEVHNINKREIGRHV